MLLVRRRYFLHLGIFFDKLRRHKTSLDLLRWFGLVLFGILLLLLTLNLSLVLLFLILVFGPLFFRALLLRTFVLIGLLLHFLWLLGFVFIFFGNFAIRSRLLTLVDYQGQLCLFVSLILKCFHGKDPTIWAFEFVKLIFVSFAISWCSGQVDLFLGLAKFFPFFCDELSQLWQIKCGISFNKSGFLVLKVNDIGRQGFLGWLRNRIIVLFITLCAFLFRPSSCSLISLLSLLLDQFILLHLDILSTYIWRCILLRW